MSADILTAPSLYVSDAHQERSFLFIKHGLSGDDFHQKNMMVRQSATHKVKRKTKKTEIR